MLDDKKDLGPSTHHSLFDRMDSSNSINSQKAWSEFVDVYAKLLFEWLCKIGLNQSDAEETVANSLGKLFIDSSMSKYDRSRPFRPWLKAVAKNVWIDIVRKRKELTGVGTFDLESKGDEFGELIEKQHRQELFRRAVKIVQSKVKERDWKLFLCSLNGETSSEIAEKFDLNPDAVRKVVQRVRDRIKGVVDGLESDLEGAN